MKRFMYSLLAIVFLFFATSNVDARKLKDIKITQAVASFAFLPISYAKAAGFYAAEGLNVTQIKTRGGGPDLVALMSGNVQFNANAGTYQIGALKKKRKLLNVYNFYKRNLISVVISAKKQKELGVSPSAPLVKRAAVLKGLRMGMTRPGSLTHKQLKHLARVGGLGEKDVRIIAIGGPPSLLAALKRDQIDGFAISPPADRIAISRGLAVMWVDNAAGADPSIDPFMMESIVTTQEYADANPDVVRAMIRATRKAVSEISKKSAKEVFDVIKGEFKKVKPDVGELAIKAVKPALNLKGNVTKKMAENTMRLDGRKEVSADELFSTYTAKFQ
ncbi:MAG: ABC transporter substrate-binding protein [Nitrospinota bacterium]|nr:ABC transporter substrate-binding protein [Nitrospinota bacterium]